MVLVMSASVNVKGNAIPSIEQVTREDIEPHPIVAIAFISAIIAVVIINIYK